MENKRKESYGITDFIKEPIVKLCFFVVCLLIVTFVMACIHVSDIAYQQKKLMIAVLGTCNIIGGVVVLLGNLCCESSESSETSHNNCGCSTEYSFTREKDPSCPESFYRHFGELWRFFLSRHPEYSHTYVEDLDERGKRAFDEVSKHYYTYLHPFERRNWCTGSSYPDDEWEEGWG